MLDGNADIDSVDFSDVLSGSVSADIASKIARGSRGRDTLLDIENLIGGGGRDMLAGDGAANFLAGNSGADSLFGRRGSDTLIGGPGADRLRGGGDGDVLSGGAQRDIFEFYEAAFGPDTITDYEDGVNGASETITNTDFDFI